MIRIYGGENVLEDEDGRRARGNRLCRNRLQWMINLVRVEMGVIEGYSAKSGWREWIADDGLRMTGAH
jgi:hypothetical protein